MRMKKFRIAKCLDNNGIHEYAIFSDGSRKKLIQTDVYDLILNGKYEITEF